MCHEHHVHHVRLKKNNASKVEKAPFETQWNVKTEATFMSCVAKETQLPKPEKCTRDATACSGQG